MHNRQVLELPPWAIVANVCVICDREFFNPFDQRVYKEVKSIAKMGHNVEIITPHETTEKKKIDDITVHCVSKKKTVRFYSFRNFKKSFSKKNMTSFIAMNLILSFIVGY
ncbi:MAG: hypothetical protein ACJZ37_00230 [Candidatus Poseidoniales archaeon]